MSPPEISVIIPAWRAERWIGRAIESVLKQPDIEAEVLVIEDGALDNTQDVVRQFKDVTFISLPHNRGAPFARNVGLAQARAEFILFLDSDDYLEGPFLAGLLDAVTRANADLGVGRCIREWPQLSRRREDTPVPTESREAFLSAWFTAMQVPLCSLLWRASDLRSVGGWDESLQRNQESGLLLRVYPLIRTICSSHAGNSVYVQAHSTQQLTRRPTVEVIPSLEKILDAASAVTEVAMRKTYLEALGRKYYDLARSAFYGGAKNDGRRLLQKARHAGFRGHAGSHRHRILTSLFGLETKERVSGSLRRLIR